MKEWPHRIQITELPDKLQTLASKYKLNGLKCEAYITPTDYALVVPEIFGAWYVDRKEYSDSLGK